MGNELQNESVFEQVELSPAEQFQLQWKQQPGFIPFVKQRNVIDQNAELLPYAGVVSLPGWASPRAFAFQGLVFVAVLLSFLNWYKTRDRGEMQDKIVALQADTQTEVNRQQGFMDAAQAETKRILGSSKPVVWKGKVIPREEALQQLSSSSEDAGKSIQQVQERMVVRETELRAEQRFWAILNSGTPLIFSLALVLAAGLVATGVRRDYPKSNVRAAGDYYLYLATAYGLWPNLGFLVALHFAMSGKTYGLTGIADTTGPLFWILFWLGFYFLLVRYFAVVARDMYKAMQVRSPLSEWSLGNKVLVRINNGFLMMFVTLEVVFLSLMYLFYLISRRLS
jgi:hypothetical protein